MKTSFLNKVIGLDSIKAELYDIYTWWNNEDYRNNKDLYLPKGILVYGNPGMGKTFIIREFAKEFNFPIYNLVGDSKNINEEIHQIYEKARNDQAAIVIIDELEKLVKDNPTVQRTLQSELDGINQKGRVITLTTSNEIDDIPRPLLRQGRIDRQFYIGFLGKEVIISLIKSNLDALKCDYSSVNFDEIYYHFKFCSASSIKNICNDVLLRFGKKITNYYLEKSLDIVELDIYDRTNLIDYRNWTVAIHEIGHLLMIKKNNKSFKFYKAIFEKHGGRCFNDIIKNDRDLNGFLAEIEIALGGYAAEKLIFKKVEVGCKDDLDEARLNIFRLIQEFSIYNPIYHKNSGPISDRKSQDDSLRNQEIIERKYNKIFNKTYKSVLKYLQKNKKLLLALADYFYNHGSINNEEADKIINNVRI